MPKSATPQGCTSQVGPLADRGQQLRFEAWVDQVRSESRLYHCDCAVRTNFPDPLNQIDGAEVWATDAPNE